MKWWHKQLRMDTAGAVTVDVIVIAAAALAMTVTVVSAMRSGTIGAIADVLTTVESTSGCVQTSESGATDLSNCQ